MGQASNQHLLLGARKAVGAFLLHVPGSIREAVLLFGFRTGSVANRNVEAQSELAIHIRVKQRGRTFAR